MFGSGLSAVWRFNWGETWEVHAEPQVNPTNPRSLGSRIPQLSSLVPLLLERFLQHAKTPASNVRPKPGFGVTELQAEPICLPHATWLLGIKWLEGPKGLSK